MQTSGTASRTANCVTFPKCLIARPPRIFLLAPGLNDCDQPFPPSKPRETTLDAFERDLLELLPRLRRFARSLARDSADADDLVQAALERALKARNQWQEGTRLDSWMYRIVRNTWIDEARARNRRAQTFVPEEAGAAATDPAHEAIERRAELRDVGRAMQALPAEQREVIALVLVEGLAYREAAEILDIPIGTLTSRLTRGRQALMHRLEAA